MWYCVSPKDRKRFEAMARSHFSNESHSCAAFMRHKDIMISPKLLRNAGIDYTVVSCRAATTGSVLSQIRTLVPPPRRQALLGPAFLVACWP